MQAGPGVVLHEERMGKKLNPGKGSRTNSEETEGMFGSRRTCPKKVEERGKKMDAVFVTRNLKQASSGESCFSKLQEPFLQIEEKKTERVKKKGGTECKGGPPGSI